MQFTITCLLLGLSACVLAYPNPLQTADELLVYEPQTQLLAENYDLDLDQEQLHRARRQLNVQGGGSPRQGIDLSVNGRVPVWQSPNGRHSLDGTGQYSQHFGGPYGNSRPNWGAGAQYTFRF